MQVEIGQQKTIRWTKRTQVVWVGSWEKEELSRFLNFDITCIVVANTTLVQVLGIALSMSSSWMEKNSFAASHLQWKLNLKLQITENINTSWCYLFHRRKIRVKLFVYLPSHQYYELSKRRWRGSGIVVPLIGIVNIRIHLGEKVPGKSPDQTSLYF